MNKELIKKYKNEFEYWLNGGELLCRQINIKVPTDWYILDDWDWSIDELEIIINDEYVELRKALAEGKTIQLQTYNRWDDILDLNSFDYPIKYYRIKPEEPKIKVGDWVRTSTGYIKPVLRTTSEQCDTLTIGNASLGINVVLKSEVELWQPKEGEWCCFWKTENKFIVAKFYCFDDNKPTFKDIDNFIVSADNIAPFIGTLPYN